MANSNEAGYSREEEFFYQRNKDLIEQRRKELDQQKAAETKDEQRSEHWMKCPKCGGDMEEVDLAHILVDKCKACQGIYFDHGELETLLESKEQGGFFTGIRRILAK